MTLKMAIKRFKAQAEEMDRYNNTKEVAKEYRQIADWLEELERRRELSERNRPISELLVDVQVENAILTKALELSCIDRSNYKELIDAYLEKARAEE